MKKVYCDVISCNFFWGIYGFTELSCWEDIVLYEEDKNGFKRVLSTCICSKYYFQSHMDELEEDSSIDEEELAWTNSAKEFLLGDSIKYQYYYDKVGDQDFYEVPFEAQRNKQGIKPSYIEIWCPSDRLDVNTVENTIKEFYEDFFNEKVLVEMKDVISIEKARDSYIEDIDLITGNAEIRFSDQVISDVMTATGKTKEEVERLLELSIK